MSSEIADSRIGQSQAISLQLRVTCPHCWNEFPPEDALWVSEHPDLVGDPRLLGSHGTRFLPSRFDSKGDAYDAKGYLCNRLACPACHLEIARPLFQISPLFFSILGAPSSGKSYFLASMTWQLRQILPQHFAISINDADATSNKRLHEYEERQFMNPNPELLVALDKTQVEGDDLYDQVLVGQQSVRYPKPFLFGLNPMQNHINARKARKLSRIVCLYDNAGESFLPGADVSTSPVTKHLALSKCLFFLFDPTQDPRFRNAVKGSSDDPQMQVRNERLSRESNVRQDTILAEAIQRVRRYAGLREDQTSQRPIIVILTKWDSWKSLLPDQDESPPYVRNPGLGISLLDQNRIQRLSRKLESLLRKLTPELVSAAEGFASELTFIPVSAIGRSPEVDPATGSLGVRPKDIKPYWVEVPMLYALNRWSGGLIGATENSVEVKRSSRSPGGKQ